MTQFLGGDSLGTKRGRRHPKLGEEARARVRESLAVKDDLRTKKFDNVG